MFEQQLIRVLEEGYPSQDELGLFSALISMTQSPGGANHFPADDAKDLASGAGKIPGKVTDARRAGQTVEFIKIGKLKDWYWKMPDGSRVRQ